MLLLYKTICLFHIKSRESPLENGSVSISEFWPKINGNPCCSVYGKLYCKIQARLWTLCDYHCKICVSSLEGASAVSWAFRSVPTFSWHSISLYESLCSISLNAPRSSVLKRYLDNALSKIKQDKMLNKLL